MPTLVLLIVLGLEDRKCKWLVNWLMPGAGPGGSNMGRAVEGSQSSAGR